MKGAGGRGLGQGAEWRNAQLAMSKGCAATRRQLQHDAGDRNRPFHDRRRSSQNGRGQAVLDFEGAGHETRGRCDIKCEVAGPQGVQNR